MFKKLEFISHRNETRFWTDILIVAAVLMDWLPSYIQSITSGGGESGIIVSGSKLLILPLLLLDLAKDSKYWLGKMRIPMVIGGLFFILMVPVFFNPSYAPFVRVRPHLFNIVLVFYFAHRRSPERCQFLLIWAVLCSSTVAFSQVLVHYGIMQPLTTHVDAGQHVERVFAVTRTATVGVFSSFCLAFLGGYLLVVYSPKRFWIALPATLIMAAAFMTPLFTAQRTVAVVAIFAALGGFLILVRTRLITALGIAVLAVILVPLSFSVMSAEIVDRWFYLLDRFSGVDLTSAYATEGSAYYRLQELKIVYSEMLPIPDLIAPGVVTFFYQMGSAPHTFLGHLYFDGGIVLLGVYTFVMVHLGYQLARAYLLEQDKRFKVALGCYTVYYLAYVLNSLVMPIMGDRVVAFTIGLGYSLVGAASINRSRLKGRVS